MTRTYQMTTVLRAVNKLTMWLARRGWGDQFVLTTSGRHSGKPHMVPVSPLDVDGTRYLVSPYGERGWVKNARDNPLVRLQNGRQDQTVTLVEMNPEQTGGLLHQYWTREKITRPYFDVGPTPTDADFAVEPEAHPVFRVVS